jgi:hypothetical protein
MPQFSIAARQPKCCHSCGLAFIGIHEDVNVTAKYTDKRDVFMRLSCIFSLRLKEFTMTSVLLDIWCSFRSLPLWVQIWVGGILVPVNMSTIFMLQQVNEQVLLIFALSMGGMVPNLYLMFKERGFSKAMALSHLVFWIPLLYFLFIWIGLVAIMAPESSFFFWHLVVLFIVNAISICFDLKDSWQWLKGDRNIAS